MLCNGRTCLNGIMKSVYWIRWMFTFNQQLTGKQLMMMLFLWVFLFLIWHVSEVVTAQLNKQTMSMFWEALICGSGVLPKQVYDEMTHYWQIPFTTRQEFEAADGDSQRYCVITLVTVKIWWNGGFLSCRIVPLIKFFYSKPVLLGR